MRLQFLTDDNERQKPM